MCTLGRYSIENWDGTYLRANENGTVTCEKAADIYTDFSYQWELKFTNNNEYWITSCAYPGRAINIENLTGSLQLTNYYDTWESAKWILEDLSDPEFAFKTDNVIFQTVDQKNYLYNGLVIGPTNTMQAFIDGNMFYEIIDKGDYCYIKYNPINNSSYGYFKASSSTTYNTSSTVDDTVDDYRWNIEENADGTVSIISVAYPGMCIANTKACTLIERATSGDTGKWNMHSANSLMIKITNNIHTYTLALNDNDREKAVFKYSGNAAPTGLDTQWQVIYSSGKMYLKNVLTGKYLKASGVDGNTQAYVTDYDSSQDYLFNWDAVNLRYPLGLWHKTGFYLHPDYQISPYEDTEELKAVVDSVNNFTNAYLDFEVIGFAY